MTTADTLSGPSGHDQTGHRLRAGWRATRALLGNEVRLFARTPAAVVLPVLMPIVATVVIAAVPAARRPAEPFGGLSVAQAYTPTLIIFAVSMATLVVLPSILGGYRELGFLRRLRTTPVSPAMLLAAFLVFMTVVSLMTALVIAGVPLLFGVPAPVRPVTFAVGVLLCVAAFLAVGTLLCAVIPNPRVATGVGNVVAALMWFCAGLWFPRAQFPAWLAGIADATPGGAAVRLMTDAMGGASMSWLAVGVCVAWSAVGATVAVRTFAWE